MPRVSRLPLLAALLTALTLSGLVPPAGAAAGSVVQAAAAEEWVGTWSAAVQRPRTTGLSADGFADQTLRLVVHSSIGGPQVRVRLSNRYGDRPVVFADVHVGVQGRGAAVVEGTNRRVRFAGQTRVSVPRGAEVVSDPVELSVPADRDLAVSVYFPSATGPATWHALPRSTNYVSASGNRTTRTDGSGFSVRTTSWFFLSGVDVLVPTAAGAVVALGDSITDGHSSTVGAERTWPDALADRLRERGVRPLGVLNQGISGNRLLTRTTCCGSSALSRLDRDVLSRPGVETVIVLAGINDIANASATRDEVVAGYSELVRRARERGLRVVGGTLTPFGGSGRYDATKERTRRAVNEWVRTSGAFDAVVDFDAAVRDPAAPSRLLPAYDSGDHLHLSDEGYAALAAAVDLRFLLAS